MARQTTLRNNALHKALTRIRQRVLHWLIHDKGWSKESLRLEHSYQWVSDPVRTRIRSDIEPPTRAGRWMDTYDDGREWLYLGTLPDADAAKWRNSRDLLANLIHYAIIRTNLREARSR